jgi:hypothetical protein
MIEEPNDIRLDLETIHPGLAVLNPAGCSIHKTNQDR